jgi:DNA-binding response OmpR family regulator/DNA-binding CsgD family transcriptional regulator
MNTSTHHDIVLVVDDSPDSLGMINTALDQAGFTVLIALNGTQALAIAEQLQPTVILLDAIMPQMDGFECCPKLRLLLPLTPIIFMTGLTETEHIVKAFEAGGNDYITKPIRPEELIARIRMHAQSARYITNARDALDVARQYVFAVNNEGEILWSTPEAEQMLSSTKDCINDLTQATREWLAEAPTEQDLNIIINQQTLIIRHFKIAGDNEHLLKLVHHDVIFNAEALEKLLQLTRREAEVLLWIAHGKSNKEIADILQMSSRTVNKHLEQLYPKILADNRASATSIAIKTLLGFHRPSKRFIISSNNNKKLMQ